MKELNFNKTDGLLPAIIQDSKTKEILMLGFMNCDAWMRTLVERRVWFYSRSKKRLWMKGESSGCMLQVNNILIDCDSDAILIQVEPSDAVCHLGNRSCFSVLEEEP